MCHLHEIFPCGLIQLSNHGNDNLNLQTSTQIFSICLSAKRSSPLEPQLYFPVVQTPDRFKFKSVRFSPPGDRPLSPALLAYISDCVVSSDQLLCGITTRLFLHSCAFTHRNLLASQRNLACRFLVDSSANLVGSFIGRAACSFVCPAKNGYTGALLVGMVCGKHRRSAAGCGLHPLFQK